MKNHLYIRRENVSSVSFAVICLVTAEGNIFFMTMVGCSNIFTKLGEKAKSCSGDVENALGLTSLLFTFYFSKEFIFRDQWLCSPELWHFMYRTKRIIQLVRRWSFHLCNFYVEPIFVASEILSSINIRQLLAHSKTSFTFTINQCIDSSNVFTIQQLSIYHLFRSILCSWTQFTLFVNLINFSLYISVHHRLKLLDSSSWTTKLTMQVKQCRKDIYYSVLNFFKMM